MDSKEKLKFAVLGGIVTLFFACPHHTSTAKDPLDGIGILLIVA
jgi:hypothetical protein